jgi:trigger factor
VEPNSRVRLNVKVPPSVCQDSYDQVLKEFSKQAKIPGFRPGKTVPDAVLINYIGPQQIRASAVEAVLKRTLPEAMSSVAGRALKESEHILTKFDDLQASFSPSLGLRYAFLGMLFVTMLNCILMFHLVLFPCL